MFYVSILMSVYNLLFTSLPPLFCGWFERDVPESFLLSHPESYAHFRRENSFTLLNFSRWMVEGFAHGLVLYFLLWGMDQCTGDAAGLVFPDGRSPDLWLLGLQVFLALIILTNIKMATSLSWVTWLNLLASFLGLVALFLVLAILSSSMFLGTEGFGLLPQLFGTHTTWLYILLSVAICYLPTMLVGGWSGPQPGAVLGAAALSPEEHAAAELAPSAASPRARQRQAMMRMFERGYAEEAAATTKPPLPTGAVAVEVEMHTMH